MRIAGIIAEYNPFHNGHAYQIQQLRALGFDAVVCVCSPSVVQRGTAALFPAPVRVRAALAGGADLLLSLPAPYAVCSAEGFAQAGVALLAALGVCEVICFGAETPQAARLHQAASLLRSQDFSARLAPELNRGLSFARARACAAEALCPGMESLLASPNNILGIEYCKALQALAQHPPTGFETLPLPVALPLARKGARHDAPLSCEQAQPAKSDAPQFASATALRALAARQGVQALQPYVPTPCLEVYRRAWQQGQIANASAFSTAVLSRLRAMDTAALARTRGVREGLEHRLEAAVARAATTDALYDLLKTKRYAHARLRRLVLDATLQYTDVFPAVPPYLHVLGATRTGLAVLKQAKNRACLPVSHSLRSLEQTGPAAAAVARAHAAAEDLAVLCLESPLPKGTAYTSKTMIVP